MFLEGVLQGYLRRIVAEVSHVELGVAVFVAPEVATAAATAAASPILAGLGAVDGDRPSVQLRLVHGTDGGVGHCGSARQGHKCKTPHPTGVPIRRNVDVRDVPAEPSELLSESVVGGVVADVADVQLDLFGGVATAGIFAAVGWGSSRGSG